MAKYKANPNRPGLMDIWNNMFQPPDTYDTAYPPDYNYPPEMKKKKLTSSAASVQDSSGRRFEDTQDRRRAKRKNYTF